MKILKLLPFIMVILIILTIDSNAQSTRIEKQHNVKHMKAHLERTEQSLLISFNSGKMGIISSSLHTLRQLEEIFPDYEFLSLKQPLIDFVKNENEDTNVRILSALALDGLHTEDGDMAIYNVSSSTTNNSLKELCLALSVESFRNELANQPTQ